MRLKFLFREVDERTSTGTETLLSLRMHRGLVAHNEVSKIPIGSAALVGYKRVNPGQMVMNRMRAAIGMFGVVPQSGLVSPDYAVLEPSPAVEQEYFLRLFKTRSAGAAFRLESTGLGTGSSGFLRLYVDRFGTIKVPLPPLAEQQAIVCSVNSQTMEAETAAERLEHEITLLREYRTRLIADVVTGKLDVRDVAANLPDESDEPEVLDGADALAEAEDVLDGDLDAVHEDAET